jgi:hypothetical protein
MALKNKNQSISLSAQAVYAIVGSMTPKESTDETI